jgi:hypothetical protein
MSTLFAAPLPDVIAEMHRLVESAAREQIHLRLMGGLAVRLRSPHAAQNALRRSYPDIDFAAGREHGRKLEPFFTRMGYTSDKSFNALNGDRRQIYHDDASGRHIDIFVGDFEMCHKIPFNGRLSADPVTVPLAELFLSKTQIVQLNRKDALDLIALLLDHPLGLGDGEQINLDHIARLCAKDWGLYTTTMMNLERVERLLTDDNPGLSAEETSLALKQTESLRQALAGQEKSLAWKARDKIGKRMSWYTEVEEVER